MTQQSSALYSAYGANELKATYQRNLLMGTASTVALVLSILIVSWVVTALGDEEAINAVPILIKTVADLGPPPTIAKKPPQVKVDVPTAAMPKVGIPTPVADDDPRMAPTRARRGAAMAFALTTVRKDQKGQR